MAFNNFRISRENLLDKFGDVSPDGRYITPFKVRGCDCVSGVHLYLYKFGDRSPDGRYITPFKVRGCDCGVYIFSYISLEIGHLTGGTSHLSR